MYDPFKKISVGEVKLCVIPLQERDGFSGALGPRGRGRARADWNMAPGGLQEVTYTIPADKCGLVIGKGSVSSCKFVPFPDKWQVKTCRELDAMPRL